MLLQRKSRQNGLKKIRKTNIMKIGENVLWQIGTKFGKVQLKQTVA